ncbi:DUF7115 domain-containing protein [Halovivax limisalsi]|uniref:DUF7115 domain-containing protein n=1 Tax=Halovivax limisalsi TaxID=1453760 RepID=UPI001FFDE555|nr:hypothetical protein [Halovivax limisalsi]
MSVPAIVESALGGADLVERVPLGGDDELFVSSESTLLYRGDGLLSDESVEEFPHDANRLSVSEGRRKTRIALEYSIDGTKEFKVPAGTTDAVVHPVVAGVLAGNGITDAGEQVVQTFRFSELTVIVTSDRLVKHIGSAVWDEDYEEFPYDDVTGLSFESGSVATQVVVEVDGRQQRIKAPNEQAPELRERLQAAVFDYHDVDSLDALAEKVGLDDEADVDSPGVDFGEGVDPLSTESASDEEASAQPEPEVAPADGDRVDEAGPTATAGGSSGAGRTAATESASDAASTTESPDRESASAESTIESPSEGTAATREESTGASDEPTGTSGDSDGFGASGFEPATAGAEADLLERLDALEETVDRQTAILERQQNTIEQLIEELRRGR